MTADKRLAIGIDLSTRNGVFVCKTNVAQQLRAIAAILWEEGIEVGRGLPGLGSARLPCPDKPHYERLHYSAFVEQDEYHHLRLIPGAVRALRLLNGRGFPIRIVTGRL